MLLTTVFDGQACYLYLSRSLVKILLRQKSSFVHWTVLVVGYLALEGNAAGDQNFTKDLMCPESCDLALCCTLFCRAVRVHDAIHLMVEALHGHISDTVEINGQPLHFFVYTVLQNSSRAETAYDYAQFQCRS